MKKTILLLAATVGTGFTCFASTPTTIADSVSLNLGTTSYTSDDAMWTDTDFTVTMTLDIVKLKNALKDSGVSKTRYNLCLFSLRSDSNNSAYTMGTMVIYTSSGSSVSTSSLWMTANGTTGYAHVNGSSDYLSTYVDNQWANADGASFTMAHSLGGSYALLTVHLSDGSFLEYECESAGLHWSGEKGVSSINIGTGNATTNPVMQAYLFDSKVSSADARAINKQLLPEPTTATLSLLALAGLAARRRRK